METAPRHEPPAERKEGREGKKPDVIVGKEETVEQAVDRYLREAESQRQELSGGAKEIEKAAADRGRELTAEERKENTEIVGEGERAAEIHARDLQGKGTVAERLKAVGFEGDPDEFLKKYPKSAENRVLRLEMDSARNKMLDIEKKLKKFEGISGKLRGATVDKWERRALELELEDVQADYKEMRGEYVDGRAGAMIRERLRIVEGRAAEVAKEKGFGSKVYDSYKKLGELNLTKLGWEPKGRVGKMVARAVSVRTGISLGLAGAGFALGAGAVAGAAAIMSRRVLSGMGASFGSYDLMRMVRDRKVGKVSREEMAKMNAGDLTAQLEVMEAKAMVDGTDLSQDRSYMDARAELNRKLKSAESGEATFAEREQGLDPKDRIDRMLNESDAKLAELKKKRKASDRTLKGVAAGIGLVVGSGALAKGVRSIKDMLFGGPSEAAEAAGAAAPNEAPSTAPERPSGAPAAEQAAPARAADTSVERPKAPKIVRPSRVELPKSAVEPEADVDGDVGKLSPEAAKILSGDVEAPATPVDVPDVAEGAAGGAAKEVAKDASERFWTEGERAVAKGLAEKGLSTDQLRQLAEGPAIGGQTLKFEVGGKEVLVPGGFESKRAAQLALEQLGERVPAASVAEAAEETVRGATEDAAPDVAEGAAKEVAKGAAEGKFFTTNEINRAAGLLENGLSRDQLRQLAEGPAIGGQTLKFDVGGKEVLVQGGFEAKRAARFALEQLGERTPTGGGAADTVEGLQGAHEEAISGLEKVRGSFGSFQDAKLPAAERLNALESVLSRGSTEYNGVKFGMIDGKAHFELPGGGAVEVTEANMDALSRFLELTKNAGTMSEDALDAKMQPIIRELYGIGEAPAAPVDVPEAAQGAAEGAAKEVAKDASERFWTEGERAVAKGLAEKGLSTDQLRQLAEGPAIRGQMLKFDVGGKEVLVPGGFESKRAAQLALEQLGERVPGAEAGDVVAETVKDAELPAEAPESAVEAVEASAVEFSKNEMTLGDGWLRNGLDAEQLKRIADAPAIRGQNFTFEVNGKPYTVAGGFEAKRAARYALEKLAGE